MSDGMAVAGPAGVAHVRHPVQARPRVGEAIVRAALAACGAFVIATTVAVLGFLARTGVRGIEAVGLRELLTGVIWKPEAGAFGGLALIVGTFTSAVGAVVLGAAPAVLAAVWLTEFAPEGMRRMHRRVMEIASAIASVVYGWLALVYLVPIMSSL